mmetsp:Transcript_38404/g.108532  ORF Transcript_38404/g.108532 Transcript_38404/m.108532 type:complete len:225 (-) Transcript_38404:1932-2606(-)
MRHAEVAVRPRRGECFDLCRPSAATVPPRGMLALTKATLLYLLPFIVACLPVKVTATHRRRLSAEYSSNDKLYGIWWELEVTLALPHIPERYASRLGSVFEEAVMSSEVLTDLRPSRVTKVSCKEPQSHLILLDGASRHKDLFGTGIYECHQELRGVTEDTVERVATANRNTMVSAINGGWSEVLEDVNSALEAEGERVVLKSGAPCSSVAAVLPQLPCASLAW